MFWLFVADYQKMYLTLFNAATDAIDTLQKAQQETEELYLSESPPSVLVLDTDEIRDENET